MLFVRVLACAVLGALVTSAGGAVVVTQWDFQNHALAINNSPAPSLGSGVARVLGMNNNLNGVVSIDGADIFGGNSANGSTDPIQGGNPVIARGWRVRGQRVPGGAAANGWSSFAAEYSQGAGFGASTAGFSGITASYDIYVTDRGPAYWQFQYTTDGTAWNNAGLVGFANLAGDRWYNSNIVDLSGIAGVNNNLNFAIRIVGTYAPGTTQYFAADAGPMSNTSGNWRFDMVTITAVPAPAAGVLISLAGFAVSRRRRA